MLENFDMLFDDENLIEKPKRSEVKAIENAPDFLNMVSWFYSNTVNFPIRVTDMLTVSNNCKLIYCGGEYIYALDFFTKSVRKVSLIGFERGFKATQVKQDLYVLNYDRDASNLSLKCYSNLNLIIGSNNKTLKNSSRE